MLSIEDIVSGSSLIPVGSAAAVVIALISYSLWLSTKFTSITDKILANREETAKQNSAISERIGKIEYKLDERFTRADFRHWEREFFRLNVDKDLRAPENGV